MTSKIDASTNALFETGSVIDDKWILIEIIGKGGMGEVFRAHQLNLKRDVAIKVISKEILQDPEESSGNVKNAVERLQIARDNIGSTRSIILIKIVGGRDLNCRWSICGYGRIIRRWNAVDNTIVRGKTIPW